MTPWSQEGDIAELRDRVTVLETRLGQTQFALIAVTIVLVVTMVAVLLIALGVDAP